jgi:nitrogen-specific signal transduction histidine kinase
VLAARVTTALVRDDIGRALLALAIVEQVDERSELQERLSEARATAHDLNNLLTAILGYAELLLQWLPLGDGARSDLEQLQAAAQRSVALVRRLLEPWPVARPAPETVDVNDVILGMQEIARHLVRAGVRFVLELDPAEPHARADVEGLERALGNLLRNADRERQALRRRAWRSSGDTERARSWDDDHALPSAGAKGRRAVGVSRGPVDACVTSPVSPARGIASAAPERP